MDESGARDVLSRYVRAIGERDYDAIREIFSDDVVVEWPQSGERVVGKEACINIFANYPGGSPKFVALRRVMGSGDVWLSEAEMDYPGGERWITVGAFEFRDGKIVHEVDWFTQPFPAPEWRMQWLDQA